MGVEPVHALLCASDLLQGDESKRGGVEDETPIFGLNLKADTQMAPATNWLSFSLMSPMEMLRSSSESESPFAQAYDTSAATVASPHYFLDNFYANGNGLMVMGLFSKFFTTVWFFVLCLVSPENLIADTVLLGQ